MITITTPSMFSPASQSRSQNKAELCFYGGVRRACDRCRKRKIRCDAQQPCNTCRKNAISCTYLYTPKKKGPRGNQIKAVDLQTESPESVEESDSGYERGQPTNEFSTSPADHQEHFSNQADNIDDCLDFHVGIVSPSQDALSAASNIYNPTTTSLVSCSSSGTHDVSTMDKRSLDYMSFDLQTNSTQRARIPIGVLVPLIEMFFDHLFPIMPVLDRVFYLSDILYRQDSLSSDDYALLTALSAVTIVQLNLPSVFVQKSLPTLSAELLVEECLHERHVSDYIENPGPPVVLTSFFLFGYYGNLEKHNKARYYLHEAISFAEAINMDDENYLSQLEPKAGQWCRRIFWLLFVTERAYALQRQNHAKIQNITIKLPAIFESEDPQLLYGFVNLVNLFLAVDITFLRSWNSKLTWSSCSRSWCIDILHRLSASRVVPEESLETHRLDIAVSRQWLQLLAWQIIVRHGLISASSTEDPFSLKYPISLAGEVLAITSAASQRSLDSHGIGMEQKIADIAGCLNDVLKCADGDMSQHFQQGREYLYSLLQQLSRMRGRQSRYLQPLLRKTDLITSQMFSDLTLTFDTHVIDLGTFVGIEGDEHLESHTGTEDLAYSTHSNVMQQRYCIGL